MIPKFRVWEESAEEGLQMWSWKEMCEIGLGQLFNNPKYELMQYTGLKDKNDVEIYEGDIVKVTQYFGGMAYGGLIHLVEKSKYNNNLMLIRQSKQRFLPEVSLRFNRSEDYEVIGNIYENPELMEVAE